MALMPPVAKAPPAIALFPPVAEAPPAVVVPPVAEAVVAPLPQDQTQEATPNTRTSDPTLFFNMQHLTEPEASRARRSSQGLFLEVTTTTEEFASCGNQYGSTHDGLACNGNENRHNMTLAVGTQSSCQSTVTGYTGVYDLSGNLHEWEDSCVASGESTACHLRGGSFHWDDLCQVVTCAAKYLVMSTLASEHVGFRCCSSP